MDIQGRNASGPWDLDLETTPRPSYLCFYLRVTEWGALRYPYSRYPQTSLDPLATCVPWSTCWGWRA